jgi:hypothetical protein
MLVFQIGPAGVICFCFFNAACRAMPGVGRPKCPVSRRRQQLHCSLREFIAFCRQYRYRVASAGAAIRDANSWIPQRRVGA